MFGLTNLEHVAFLCWFQGFSLQGITRRLNIEGDGERGLDLSKKEVGKILDSARLKVGVNLDNRRAGRLSNLVEQALSTTKNESTCIDFIVPSAHDFKKRFEISQQEDFAARCRDLNGMMEEMITHPKSNPAGCHNLPMLHHYSRSVIDQVIPQWERAGWYIRTQTDDEGKLRAIAISDSPIEWEYETYNEYP